MQGNSKTGRSSIHFLMAPFMSITHVSTGANCGIHGVHVLVRCDSLHLGSCSTDLKFSAETLVWQSAGIPLIFDFNLIILPCML